MNIEEGQKLTEESTEAEIATVHSGETKQSEAMDVDEKDEKTESDQKAEVVKPEKEDEEANVESNSETIENKEVVDQVLEACDNETFEAFLNGFIVYKRGKEEAKPGVKKKAPLPIKVRKSINNVILKKLKIAFSLTNEDMIELFEKEGVSMTKNELTTYFRKEGHKHYRRLEDYYLKNFLTAVSKL